MEIDLLNGCCPPPFFDRKFTEIKCESKNGSVIRGTVMEIQLLDRCCSGLFVAYIAQKFST
jgi:hypothetical protein